MFCFCPVHAHFGACLFCPICVFVDFFLFSRLCLFFLSRGVFLSSCQPKKPKHPQNRKPPCDEIHRSPCLTKKNRCSKQSFPPPQNAILRFPFFTGESEGSPSKEKNYLSQHGRDGCSSTVTEDVHQQEHCCATGQEGTPTVRTGLTNASAQPGTDCVFALARSRTKCASPQRTGCRPPLRERPTWRDPCHQKPPGSFGPCGAGAASKATQGNVCEPRRLREGAKRERCQSPARPHAMLEGLQQ